MSGFGEHFYWRRRRMGFAVLAALSGEAGGGGASLLYPVRASDTDLYLADAVSGYEYPSQEPYPYLRSDTLDSSGATIARGDSVEDVYLYDAQTGAGVTAAVITGQPFNKRGTVPANGRVLGLGPMSASKNIKINLTTEGWSSSAAGVMTIIVYGTTGTVATTEPWVNRAATPSDGLQVSWYGPGGASGVVRIGTYDDPNGALTPLDIAIPASTPVIVIASWDGTTMRGRIYNRTTGALLGSGSQEYISGTSGGFDIRRDHNLGNIVTLGTSSVLSPFEIHVIPDVDLITDDVAACDDIGDGTDWSAGGLVEKVYNGGRSGVWDPRAIPNDAGGYSPGDIVGQPWTPGNTDGSGFISNGGVQNCVIVPNSRTLIPNGNYTVFVWAEETNNTSSGDTVYLNFWIGGGPRGVIVRRRVSGGFRYWEASVRRDSDASQIAQASVNVGTTVRPILLAVTVTGSGASGTVIIRAYNATGALIGSDSDTWALNNVNFNYDILIGSSNIDTMSSVKVALYEGVLSTGVQDDIADGTDITGGGTLLYTWGGIEEGAYTEATAPALVPQTGSGDAAIHDTIGTTMVPFRRNSGFTLAPFETTLSAVTHGPVFGYFYLRTGGGVSEGDTVGTPDVWNAVTGQFEGGNLNSGDEFYGRSRDGGPIEHPLLTRDPFITGDIRAQSNWSITQYIDNFEIPAAPWTMVFDFESIQISVFEVIWGRPIGTIGGFSFFYSSTANEFQFTANTDAGALNATAAVARSGGARIAACSWDGTTMRLAVYGSDGTFINEATATPASPPTLPIANTWLGRNRSDGTNVPYLGTYLTARRFDAELIANRGSAGGMDGVADGTDITGGGTLALTINGARSKVWDPRGANSPTPIITRPTQYGWRRNAGGASLTATTLTVPSEFTCIVPFRAGVTSTAFTTLFAFEDNTRDLIMRFANTATPDLQVVCRRASDSAQVTVAIPQSTHGVDPRAGEGLTEYVHVARVSGTTIYNTLFDRDGNKIAEATGTLTGGPATGAVTTAAYNPPIRLLNHPAGTQQYNGSAGVAYLGRYMDDTAVSAAIVASIASLVDDDDILLLPRTDTAVGTTADETAWKDPEGPGGWSYTGTAASLWVTEDFKTNADRSPIMILEGQSNARTAGVTYTGSQPVIIGRMWQEDGFEGFLDYIGEGDVGPEMAWLEESGNTYRVVLKNARGSTTIQNHIDIYWPEIESRFVSFGYNPAFVSCCLLYLQGEADSQDSVSAAAYAGRLATLAASWRAAGVDRIILGGIPTIGAVGYDWQDDIRDAQIAYAAANADAVYIDNTDLATQGDLLHWTEASSRTVGERTLVEVYAEGTWDQPVARNVVSEAFPIGRPYLIDGANDRTKADLNNGHIVAPAIGRAVTYAVRCVWTDTASTQRGVVVTADGDDTIATTGGHNLNICEPTGTVQMVARNSGGVTQGVAQTPANPVSDGTEVWVFGCVDATNVKVRVYDLAGTQQGAGVDTGTGHVLTGWAFFGADPVGADPTNGTTFEVRVYDGYLTDAQLAAIADGTDPSGAGTFLYAINGTTEDTYTEDDSPNLIVEAGTGADVTAKSV